MAVPTEKIKLKPPLFRGGFIFLEKTKKHLNLFGKDGIIAYHDLEVYNMKKILCMVLILAALVLVSCGGNTDATTATTESTAPTTTAATTTPAAETTAVTTTPATTTVVTTTETPVTTPSELDEILANKTKLTFGDDGEFRVLCLADLHLQRRQTAGVLANVKKIVEREKPDLIILLGDVVTDANILNFAEFKTTLGGVVDYFEENNIYWMHVFGNHDSELKGSPKERLTLEAQQELYESYPHCLSKAGDKSISGVGNYVVPLYGKDDELKFAFWCMDSGSYISAKDKAALFGDGKAAYSGLNQTTVDYAFVQYDQIEWYLKVSRMLEKENDGLVPGLMAMHIPLQEIFTAWENRSKLEWTGQKNEYVSSGCHNSGFYEAMRYRGDIKSCVFGHDHKNDYMVNYGGIKLAFCSNLSRTTYYQEDMMGARVYVIKESDPENFETYISYLNKQIEKPTEALSGMLTDFESMKADDFVLGHLDGSLKNIETVSATVAANKGVNGSSALAACRTQWYENPVQDNNMEVKWQLPKAGLLGNNKYLVVWMDLDTNNLDFRKACFGLLTDGKTESPYRADDKEAGCKFFYKADGSDTWEEKAMGQDGCFGAGDNCSVAGYKGYFAFPIDDMYCGSSKLNANSAISGIYFYMSALSSEMAGKPVYVDNIQLVADYQTVK